MTFFNNIKISIKLSVLIIIALLSMGVIGYTGYYYLQQSNSDMKSMYADRLIPVKLANEIRANVAIANAATLELMLTTDDKRNKELKKIIDDTSKQSNDNLTEFEKAHLDPKGKDLLAKAQTTRKLYRDARQQVIELAMQNKNAEAYALYVMSVSPLAIEYMGNIHDITSYYSTLSEKTSADTQAAFEKSMQITVGILVVAFIVLGMSGWYITKIIATPLNAMVLFCKELAAGDFRDKPRNEVRKDEIGQVADALVDMRDALRQLMKQINESAEQLAASSEELTASADQSAQAANQVAESITGVANGAEKQLSVASDTSAVVQQMSASIQQVAANANEAAEQTAQAVDKAKDGNKSVDKAVNQMASIEQTVTSSAQVVAKLGERSKEIGQIVDTIAGIAGQTNLLALNAAIEAARAGEQGRGFAVVAEEVRKLAEQSQDAAKQIATLISEIQGDTDKAVVAMEDGTREVKVGAEVVNESGKAFQEIAAMVINVSDKTREISAAMEQMAIGSQQIVGSVKQIDELSKNASGEAQTVSAATEEQSASMEEIASSSQALAHLAMDLREAVSKFQI
ncbi:methyl-accepting chemotaxis protein [Pelosinus sp. IPA-1]|uniref:methyl-accepting chemotaxis protein n=1 Tax=Pelosinus sp. IPA-1 TaxID=3029569 RepID=UPI0024361867|nr:methyl-accepting chemotaxis protein [Pelosinus sp. IPA-1]GMB01931.1 methyl-accepting chemotaxis protein [Pelosinus sp. IPA-1]